MQYNHLDVEAYDELLRDLLLERRSKAGFHAFISAHERAANWFQEAWGSASVSHNGVDVFAATSVDDRVSEGRIAALRLLNLYHVVYNLIALRGIQTLYREALSYTKLEVGSTISYTHPTGKQLVSWSDREFKSQPLRDVHLEGMHRRSPLYACQLTASVSSHDILWAYPSAAVVSEAEDLVYALTESATAVADPLADDLSDLGDQIRRLRKVMESPLVQREREYIVRMPAAGLKAKVLSVELVKQ